MKLREGKIISLRSRAGMFVIEQIPNNKDGLYAVHKYNDKYHLIYVPESDILPLLPNHCFHSFRTVDIGLGAKNEIRYCTYCGIKIEDIDQILKGSE